MERRRKYLKLLAFVPAIVLVSGFIGYRAGAFELFSKPEPQPEAQPVAAPQELADSATTTRARKQTTHVPARLQIDQPDRHHNRPHAGRHVRSRPGCAGSHTARKPPTFMGGSKSKPVFTPPAPNSGTQQAAHADSASTVTHLRGQRSTLERSSR